MRSAPSAELDDALAPRLGEDTAETRGREVEGELAEEKEVEEVRAARGVAGEEAGDEAGDDLRVAPAFGGRGGGLLTGSCAGG